MTVKRFFGETAREALRKVKAALGPEAIVISNKSVPGGVEIMAMSADSLEALQGENKSAPAAASVMKPATQPVQTPVNAVPPAPTSMAPHARNPGPLPPTGGGVGLGRPCADL